MYVVYAIGNTMPCVYAVGNRVEMIGKDLYVGIRGLLASDDTRARRASVLVDTRPPNSDWR